MIKTNGLKDPAYIFFRFVLLSCIHVIVSWLHFNLIRSVASTGLIWIQNYSFEVLFEQMPILSHSSSSLNFSSPLKSSSCLISLGENSNYLLTQPRIERWCWIINGHTLSLSLLHRQDLWVNICSTQYKCDNMDLVPKQREAQQDSIHRKFVMWGNLSCGAMSRILHITKMDQFVIDSHDTIARHDNFSCGKNCLACAGILLHMKTFAP